MRLTKAELIEQIAVYQRVMEAMQAENAALREERDAANARVEAAIETYRTLRAALNDAESRLETARQVYRQQRDELRQRRH